MQAIHGARRRASFRSLSLAAAALSAVIAGPSRAGAQNADALDSLVRRAVATNSSIRAAQTRVEAARALVSPASAWPDPMLMLGVMNVMIGGERKSAPAAMGADPMRMNVVGLEQTVPFPGKLRLARQASEARLRAAEAELARARLEISGQVRRAYYDAAFGTRALHVVDHNANVLSSLIAASEARYTSAGGSQVEVLNARVEATRLGETAAELSEARRAAVARLNALLEREPSTVVVADFPSELIRAAAPASSLQARFESAALGARAAGSPLKTPEELQRLARDSSPILMRHRALIETALAQAELAGREFLPDLTASLEYGQRPNLPDMVSARVSFPLPIFKRRKQDQLVVAARGDVVAAEAEFVAVEQELFGRIAALHADVELQRTRLALYVSALIPQGQATVQASLATFQSGRTSLFEVLGHQATLFRYETEYFRALADFAKGLTELEQLVGAEVLR